MRDHAKEEHPDDEVKFKFELVKSCTTPLERQVGESIVIKLMQKSGVSIINSKTEYNRCVLPSIMVTGGENTKKEEKAEKKERTKQKEEEVLKNFENDRREEEMKRDRETDSNKEAGEGMKRKDDDKRIRLDDDYQEEDVTTAASGSQESGVEDETLEQGMLSSEELGVKQYQGTDKYQSNDTVASIMKPPVMIPRICKDNESDSPGIGKGKSDHHRRQDILKVKRETGMSCTKKYKMTKKGRIYTPKKGSKDLITNHFLRITGEQHEGAREDEEDDIEEQSQANNILNNQINPLPIKAASKGAGDPIGAQGGEVTKGGTDAWDWPQDTDSESEDNKENRHVKEPKEQKTGGPGSKRRRNVLNKSSVKINSGSKAKARAGACCKKKEGFDKSIQLGIKIYMIKDVNPDKPQGNSQDNGPDSQLNLSTVYKNELTM